MITPSNLVVGLTATKRSRFYMKIKLNNPFQTVALLMAILKLNGQSFKFEIPKSVKVKEFKR